MPYFNEHGIELLPWPPKSPDLSLIESVWNFLKKNLKSSYQSREELEKDIVRCWKNISSEYIGHLYSTIKDRIQAVIEAQGGPTDY